MSEKQESAETLAQKYVTWRRRTLGWMILSFFVTLLLGFCQSTMTISFEMDLPEEDNGPPWLVAYALIFGGYLAVVVLPTLWLVPASAWPWAHPARSRWRARTALVLLVFGPLPLFFVPWTSVLGMEVSSLSLVWENQFKLFATWILPTFFSLLPGTTRAALTIKQLLPESILPGWLLVLTAVLGLPVWLMLLAVSIQFGLPGVVIGGLFLLTASRSLRVVLAPWLIRRNTVVQAQWLIRRMLWTGRLLTGSGLACLGWYAWVQLPLLMELLRPFVDAVAKLDEQIVESVERYVLWQSAYFAASLLGSKGLVTVVLADLILGMSRGERESARLLSGTSMGADVDARLDALKRVFQG